jgi:prepilin signal peptidase PulO-like enzyme (type II secretory pathway)
MDNTSIIPLATNFLDFLLIAAAVWMAITVAKLRLGGALSSSVNRIVVGAAILGVAHVVETLSLQYGMDEHINELLHRGIILAGFVALTLGIRSLVGAFGKAKA